jgi:hypothetical protein
MSVVPRTKVEDKYIIYPPKYDVNNKQVEPSIKEGAGSTTSTLWKSQGNPIDRKTGNRKGGGGFHVTHHGTFVDPGVVNNVYWPSAGRFYSGPIRGSFIKSSHWNNYKQNPQTKPDESGLNSAGTTAIALCAPNNPTANVSSTLGESMRDGIPSLPGIQLWKGKTEILKSLGSEYLNVQFGWRPLVDEVNNVVNAARNHRDILQNYRHNEGRDVHRSFEFEDEVQKWEEQFPPANAVGWPSANKYANLSNPAEVVTVVENRRKRWFEGCFTYGGPSNSDNFGRHLGFGSDADALYGLTLSPDVLWEMTPWSWAVDWFTNAGDVIHNFTNFAAAGLVMRYGYMMEENISTTYTRYGSSSWNGLSNGRTGKTISKREGPCSSGYMSVSKSRVPANPFGFGVGWEGLSPTQLAITAAIGITRFL